MSERSRAREPRIFNPASPEFIRDPYPAYHQLRRMAPLFKTPRGFWLAARYGEVNAILRDKRFGKDIEPHFKRLLGEDVFDLPIYRFMRHLMAMQNPPNHSRLRNLVARVFAHKRIDALRPRIQEIVDKLIDDVEGKGGMNVIQDFAYPLPVEVICDMLGVPAEDRRKFYSQAEVAGRLLDAASLSPEEIEQISRRYVEDAAYFQGLVDERRKSPRDDLLSIMAEANEDGDRLSDEELIANTLFLFAAGHETTANLIGNGLLALLSTPGQLDALKSDPSLITGAVEEMLRFDSSIQLSTRCALEDVQMNDVKIARGETVVTLLGAANRDPEQFENPDRFDVTRKKVRSCSFGGGIHHCLGAPLVQAEVEIAFETLIRRLPNMRIPDPDRLSFKQTYSLRGLVDLPIVF